MHTCFISCTKKVGNAIKYNVDIVDIDGSYLYKKLNHFKQLA